MSDKEISWTLEDIENCKFDLVGYMTKQFDLHRSIGNIPFTQKYTPKFVIKDFSAKAECTCTSKHLFDFGCTCGFLRKNSCE